MTDEELRANELYHTCGRCKYEDYSDQMYPCNQCKHGTDLRKDLWELNTEKHSCADCLLDGTDACSRGADRAVDDRICEGFI